MENLVLCVYRGLHILYTVVNAQSVYLSTVNMNSLCTSPKIKNNKKMTITEMFSDA